MARKWDKERVIVAIHERERLGLPMTSVWRDDNALNCAAHVHFGSWRKALLAAGVTGFPPHTRRSSEAVIKGIRTRHLRGVLQATIREDRGLYSAAQYRFGSWRKAVTAAGIAMPDNPPIKWSKQLIIKQIRERRRRGLPLAGMNRQDPILRSAAYRYFGGWSKAVEAAGIRPPRRTAWTREGILKAIRLRHRRGLPLRGVFDHDPRLASAAVRLFGSWREAVLAAGLEPTSRRRWTKQTLIDALREWHPQGKLKGNVWEEDGTFATSVARHFGSWNAGLQAAGIEPRRQMWTRELVLRELRAWRQGPCRAGLSTENPRLAKAAGKLFGSCNNALRAAGLEPRRRGRTPEQLIEAIQDRYIKGGRLRYPFPKSDTPLVSAAVYRFGSWRKALAAAGLEDVLPPPRAKWSPQLVVREIQRWHEQGRPFTRVWKEYPTLRAAAVKYHGSWHKAVAAAGLANATKRTTGARRRDHDRS